MVSSNLDDFQRSFRNSLVRDQKALHGSLLRDQKALQKSIGKQVGLSISKEGRIRVPAKRRHEVEEKYHNKCAVCKKKPCKLQIHHKNMKNNDPRLINLELLCPTHHIKKHEKVFRKKYKSGVTRLITKKKNKELNRRKAKQRRNDNPFKGLLD